MGLKEKDSRMELCREVVTNSKCIKQLRWESVWYDRIEEVREREFRYVRISKWLDSLCVLFWSITNTLISSVTLMYFANKDNGNL